MQKSNYSDRQPRKSIKFGINMSVLRWKSFEENEDRPDKPRRYGVTEMRGPHYTLLTQNVLQVPSFFSFFFFFFA